MPQYKVIVEKKVLLSMIVEEEDPKDALRFVTQFIGKNYSNKESLKIVDGNEILESPLNISIVGAPEVLEETKKELIIETKGN